jgi:hypothetical protein
MGIRPDHRYMFIDLEFDIIVQISQKDTKIVKLWPSCITPVCSKDVIC